MRGRVRGRGRGRGRVRVRSIGLGSGLGFEACVAYRDPLVAHAVLALQRDQVGRLG